MPRNVCFSTQAYVCFMLNYVLLTQCPGKVLTRRQQLRVAAEEKADKLAEKEGKKQPAPKAGGRGRGRGRGRGKAKVVDPETVPEPHGEVSSPTKKSVDSDMEVDEQKVSQKDLCIPQSAESFSRMMMIWL